MVSRQYLRAHEKIIQLNVRNLREGQNMTQRQLSAKAKISNRCLQSVEGADGRLPTIPTLLAIGRALGVTLGDLISAPYRSTQKELESDRAFRIKWQVLDLINDADEKIIQDLIKRLEY